MGLESYIKEKYSYDPESGDVIGPSGSPLRSRHKSYYRAIIYYNGKAHHKYLHRIAWLLHTGDWPEDQIDHINGDGQDNRLCNLRVVDDITNKRNRRLQSNNKSGYPGILWNKKLSKWQVQIKENRYMKYLGVYENFEEALKVRETAEQALGFHENNGRT